VTSSLGVVCLPALDLRLRPDHRAELGSQLLLGEVVRLGASRKGWWRVRNEADGYSGWVRDWGFVAVPARRAAAWRRAASARVCAPITQVRARPAGGIGVGPLFFGSRVIPGEASRGWVRVELPDARCGWVERSSLCLPEDEQCSLVDRITSLLGSPYLWGGRTPAGYDCSAFVQQVLLEQGVSLPRDASEQHGRCRPLRPGEAPVPGDLAFFADRTGRIAHVGISLSGTLFAHARGRVAVASLDHGNALYDSALRPQLVGWSRPRARRLQG
jgi:hypothetical protein